MSRRNRRKNRTSSPPASTTAQPTKPILTKSELSEPAHSDRQTGQPRKLVRIAILLAILWLPALASLALLTANPITLNRLQIAQADFIVTAKFDVESKEAIVEKEWKQGARLERIRIASLDFETVETGILYILPVTQRADKTFEITRARLLSKAVIGPGMVIPVDGIVTEGTTTVSEPGAGDKPAIVEKRPGDQVLADSVNIKNEIEFIALSPSYFYRAEPDAIRQLERMLNEFR